MITSSPQHRWQLLYRAAILEQDWSRIGDRVSQAQRAIVDRKRELAQNTGQQAQLEEEAMDDALYTLHALESTNEHRLNAA